MNTDDFAARSTDYSSVWSEYLTRWTSAKSFPGDEVRCEGNSVQLGLVLSSLSPYCSPILMSLQGRWLSLNPLIYFDFLRLRTVTSELR